MVDGMNVQSPDTKGMLKKAADCFRARFHQEPVHAAMAPGRVNLIGEHTDYNAGFVLPIAIDRYAMVIASPCPGHETTIYAPDLDDAMVSVDSSNLQPLQASAQRFANYPLGVFDQFRKLGHEPPTMNVLITGSIPPGAGLSSSAAVEVATATMLQAECLTHLTPERIVEIAQEAEHEFPGTPCGIMDMYISARAVEGHALLIDCQNNSSKPIPMPQLRRRSS